MSITHYRAGAVFTSDIEPWAQSIVVDGERIAFVGSTADADLMHADRVIELGGALVIPGIVDAHTHLVGMGEAIAQVPLQDAADLAEIQRRLADAAVEPSERIVGRSWLFSALGGRMPHRELIDAVVSDRPVYLIANDNHSSWVNSAALVELGIDDATPDPIGGTIERDSTGVATGYLLENASLALMRDRLTELTGDTEREGALRAAFESYLASGVTAAVDMALGEAELRALVALQGEGGRLPMRVAAHWVVDRTASVEGGLAEVRRAAELAELHRGPWLRVTGIKIFVDGVIDS